MKILYSAIFLTIIAVILCFSVGAFYAYFYPMTYKEFIVDLGARFEVEPCLIASVANVESGFNEKAKSNKGAIGIMQLMPTTAQWIADKIGENFNEENLYNGEYNLKLGSYYLSYLLLQFEDYKTALCAYNAGQGNVAKWLKDEKYSKDGIVLKKIPFEETKNYLNKVLKNYYHYKIKYK